MARFISELVMRLTDAVTAPARQMRQSITGLTTAIKASNVAALEASSRSLSRTMRGVTAELAVSTAGLVAYAAALARPISAAAEFQAKLTTIGQKAEMSRKDMTIMGASIRALSTAVNQSVKGVAEGVDVLAGAGLDPRLALRLINPIGKAATAYKAEIGDLAKASFAAYQNLKVPVDQVSLALDAMAVAGKKGNFELGDMARFFPSLAAAAGGLKQQGVGAVADLSAALQIAMRGAGSAEEAATNVGNLMQKLRDPQTEKAFAKMGVNLVASLNKLEAEGRTPIEAIAELTQKTLGGNLSKLGYLFQDAQVRKALLPLITNMKEYQAIRAAAMAANGTVDRDFIKRQEDAEQRINAAKVAAENLKISLGTALLPAVGNLAAAITPLVTRLTAFIDAHPKLVSQVATAVGAFLTFRVAMTAVNLVGLAGKKGLVDLALGFLGAGNGATSAASILGRSAGAMKGALAGVVRISTLAVDGLGTGLKAGANIAVTSLGRLGGVTFSGLGQRLLGMRAAFTGLIARVRLLPSLARTAFAASGGAVRGLISALNPTSIVGFGRALIGLVNPMAIARGAMMAFRLALIGTGVGAIVVGIGLAAAFVIQHWRGFVTFFQGVGRGFMAAIAPVRPALQPFIDAIGGLFASLGKFFSGKPGEDWSKYGVAIGQALGGGVLALVNFARWVGECIDKLSIFFGLKGKPPGEEVERRFSLFRFGRRDDPPAPAGGKPKPRLFQARARGGPVLPGRDYVVGEEGVEVVRFDRAGRVFPNGVRPPPVSPSMPELASLGPSAGGSGGARTAGPASRTIHYAPTYNLYGVTDPKALVRQAMEDLKRAVDDFGGSGMFDSEVRTA